MAHLKSWHWEYYHKDVGEEISTPRNPVHHVRHSCHLTCACPESLQIWVFFGQSKLIPIADLFDFSQDGGFSEFWSQGVKNYREEMMFYELLFQANCGGDEHDMNEREVQGVHDTVVELLDT